MRQRLRVATSVAIGGDDGTVRRYRRRWTLLQVSAAAKIVSISLTRNWRSPIQYVT
jgi:hypothetical protein